METKNIICFGDGYKDYVIYMSYILNNIGYKVVINDMTSEKELANIISCSNFEIPIRTYRNIDFNFGECLWEGYDYSIIYSNDIEILLKMNDEYGLRNITYVIINVSVYKNMLLICRDFIQKMNRDVIFILRDRVGYIDMHYVMKHIITEDRIVDNHEIKYHKQDKKYEYEMEYGGIVAFENLSGDYRSSLVRCVAIITCQKKKKVKKALAKAMKGCIVTA